MSEKEQMDQFNRLSHEISQGNIEDLLCPICKTQEIEYSFTYLSESDRYGLIIQCQGCSFHHHTRFTKKPKGFDGSKIIERLQKIEESVAEEAKKVVKKILEGT